MSFLKYLGYFLFGGFVLKLLFTNSAVPILIVLSVLIFGLYFLIKHQLFWQVYAFVFSAIAITTSIGFTFLEYEFLDYLAIPFTILTSVALFAFAYKRVLLNRLVWIFVFFINVLFLIIPYGDDTSIFEDINEYGLVGGTVILILYSYLLFTQYVGLFMYAFYSDDLWKDSEIEGKIIA